jgi:hypothetical protein
MEITIFTDDYSLTVESDPLDLTVPTDDNSITVEDE